MNFTASIKSARIKPNYILNLSIDIPLKSKKILSDRSHNAELSFSPNPIKLHKKMKLSLPPSSVQKTTQNADSRKLSLGETQNTVSGINKRKTMQSMCSHQRRQKGKNKSCEVSPKKLVRMKSKDKKKSLATSSKILQKLANESEDNIIKYTNESAEMKKQLKVKVVTSNQKERQNSEGIDIGFIRDSQKNVTQRKQHLNYLYLRQKLLVLASVKKIQRAWRNYRTKKLITSYSSNISIKYTNKMSISSNQNNVLTVRSLAVDAEKQKQELKEQSREIEQEKRRRKKRRKKQKEESLRQFQIQQIKKWEQLTNQIQMGKKLEEVLESSFQRKKQLEEDLQKYQNEESSSFRTDSERKSEENLTSEERRKKEKEFQNKIRQIDNENSDADSFNEFEEEFDNGEKVSEEIENKKLKKKLKIFNKFELIYWNEEENGKEEEKKQTSGKNTNSHKIQMYKSKVGKLSEKEKKKFIENVVEELIYEIFLQISESDRLIQRMKDLYDASLVQKKKPEGICTNLQSIKDYLENLVAYIFQQYPDLLLERLMQPCGSTPILLFSSFRNDEPLEETNKFALTQVLFEEHWAYASEQIYFDAKYNDEQDERQRVRYLKNLTKVYFRAIFDAFNECLQPFRIYGLEGKPYPWKKKIVRVQMPDPKKVVRSAYKRLSVFALIFCGIHLQEKKDVISKSMIKEIQNERMNTLLETELGEEQYKWRMYEDWQAQMLLRISEGLLQQIMKEFFQEYNNFS